MNLQKQQLKHAHRDRMIAIGIEAITHALHLIPQNSDAFKTIQNYLGLIRDKDVQQIQKAIRDINKPVLIRDMYFYPDNDVPRYELRMLEAARQLLKLSISEQYLSGDMLEFVLVPAWNGAEWPEQQQLKEKQFQDSVLRPKIDQSFKQLQIAEKKLK